MKPINADKYYELVLNSFQGIQPVENEDITIISETQFRIQWVNSIRFNSYIAYTDSLDAETLISYVSRCYYLQKKNRNMMVTPVACYAVVICENTDKRAVDIALMKPRLHMTLDMFPVVVDLKNAKIHYYNGPMILRLLFNRYERVYIDEHFGKPLRALSGQLSLK